MGERPPALLPIRRSIPHPFRIHFAPISHPFRIHFASMYSWGVALGRRQPLKIPSNPKEILTFLDTLENVSIPLGLLGIFESLEKKFG